MRALVYGAMNPDLVHEVDHVPAVGDDIRSTAWQLTWGGKAANAAVALAEWGVDTRLLGLVIGTDALGDALVDALDRPNLDRSFLERDPNDATRHCIILHTPDGDRTIVCAGYDDARWQKADDAAFADVDVVLIDGLGRAGAHAVAKTALAREIPTVWLDAPDPLPAPVDLVVWSRHEHRAPAADALVTPTTAVALTDGAKPIRVSSSDGVFEVDPPAIVPADSTGSGDVFAAACAYGLGRTWELERTVRWASAAGAAATSLPRTGVPTRDDIERLLD
ncbi:MAG: carbohydrate kinase family protein [Acidimicrobiia bacterium]|nr:carbohydrate kinase family protein [Acidimicrobiia bacterium]